MIVYAMKLIQTFFNHTVVRWGAAICIIGALFSFGGLSCAVENEITVRFETSEGDFTAVLFADEAPVTVENFMRYVDEGFFTDTIFHRVIPSFVIQGGGFTADLQRKEPYDAIINEANNGISNTRGTLAMARTNDINSATSQFFINLVDNSFLDHRDTSESGFGYAVFGEVVSGIEVVDSIATVETGTLDGFQNVPVTPILITGVTVE